jgi:hypothetical protein
VAFRLVLPVLLLAAAPRPAGGQSAVPPPGRVELFRDLATDGLAGWSEIRLANRPSRYRVASEGERPVLSAESYGGNSAVWRRVDVAADRGTTVSWRWKVERSLSGNRRERSRRGDDFAARVFVVFDAPEGPWSGKALCYVWAATEPVGSIYASPYTGDVAMIVMESGDARAGSWVDVERNVLEDYRRAFGGVPATLSGIAIVVDTDNTQSRARAWFDRLVVSRSP